MLAAIFLTTAVLAQADVPPVPGRCVDPMPSNKEAPGCYQTGRIDLAGAPASLFWQLHEFPTPAAARKEAKRHRWASVAEAHSRTWLHVLASEQEIVKGGQRRAMVGPLRVPAAPAVAYFAESIFPPGMQTRVHAHPGPEAFYVVDGEQCMESPAEKRLLVAGNAYIVEEGPHLQAAPKGRRNLVLILAPAGQPPIQVGNQWQPTGFCEK